MPNPTVPAAATGLPKFYRRDVEDAIDRLIYLLDIADGDCDLEDGSDAEDDKGDSEPSLGWTWSEAATGHYAPVIYGLVDLEDEHDGCEPEDDKAADDDPCDCDPNQPEGGDLGWAENRWERPAIQISGGQANG